MSRASKSSSGNGPGRQGAFPFRRPASAQAEVHHRNGRVPVPGIPAGVGDRDADRSGRLDGTSRGRVADPDRDRFGTPHRRVVCGSAGAGTDRGAAGRGDKRSHAAPSPACDRGRVPDAAAGTAGDLRRVGPGAAVGRIRADRAGRRRPFVRDAVHPGAGDRLGSTPRRDERGRAAVGRRPRSGRAGRAARRRRDRQLRHPRRPVRRRGRISDRRAGGGDDAPRHAAWRTRRAPRHLGTEGRGRRIARDVLRAAGADAAGAGGAGGDVRIRLPLGAARRRPQRAGGGRGRAGRAEHDGRLRLAGGGARADRDRQPPPQGSVADRHHPGLRRVPARVRLLGRVRPVAGPDHRRGSDGGGVRRDAVDPAAATRAGQHARARHRRLGVRNRLRVDRLPGPRRRRGIRRRAVGAGRHGSTGSANRSRRRRGLPRSCARRSRDRYSQRFLRKITSRPAAMATITAHTAG